MRASKTITFISVIVVVAAAIAWTVRSRQRGSGANTRQLADGSILRLKRVSYQKTYRVRTDTRWQDYVGLALSDSLAKQVNARFLTVGGRTNALDFWLD